MNNQSLKNYSEYTPIGISIYSLLYKNCADCKEKPALSYFDKEITFGELFEIIDRTASPIILCSKQNRCRILRNGLP